LDGRHVTQRRFRAVLDRAGLPRIRFQDLRHGQRLRAIVTEHHTRNRKAGLICSISPT
jgi:hypothetical protein